MFKALTWLIYSLSVLNFLSVIQFKIENVIWTILGVTVIIVSKRKGFKI